TMLTAEIARALEPFQKPAGDINRLRENLLDLMWDDVGVVRDAEGLARGVGKLDEIERELLATGVADTDRAFNLTWQDWLNLRSLCETSRVIALAALRRENSRGAHYRSDFPDPGDFETSRFTVARQVGAKVEVSEEPVRFTHIKPGQSLLTADIAAE
ncbi:MAG TPA: succinate dehydrogenase/fumarate reductase flavoprotein subunit, partial [Acidocella sp.]|nr:succinate dehydrogenase/fumarate reductase flavoprotein subunit [Acidocella sp.]